MKSANELSQTLILGQKLYQDPINEKSKQPEGISKNLWFEVWTRLEATKLVWEETDSSTSEYWRVTLDGYSEEDLMRGCNGADNWSKSKADFTVGAFKKLCKQPIFNAAYLPAPQRHFPSDMSKKARIKAASVAVAIMKNAK